MSKEYPVTTRHHLSIAVDKGIELIKKGRNVLVQSDKEAMKVLLANKKEGKKFYTGCGKEDAEGKCAGHSHKTFNEHY